MLSIFYRLTAGNEKVILQSHHSRSEVVKNQGRKFVCRPEYYCSLLRRYHYGRHPEAREWYHQWVYFRPPRTGIGYGLTGRQYLPIRVSFWRMTHQPHFSDLLGQIVNAGQEGRALFGAAGDKSAWQLLLRRMEATSRSLHHRWIIRYAKACRVHQRSLADPTNFDVASVLSFARRVASVTSFPPAVRD